jgi:non-heme chloroperoxidase
MGWLEREGGRRIYFEDFRGPGRPILLIHGWAMSGRAWDGVTAALSRDGHRVVAFDQRGCGQSDKDFEDCTIAASAGDAVGLCEALGLEGVVVNGWSLGGAVAAEASARLGDRCGGLVLTCGASPRYTRADGFPFGGTLEDVQGILAELARDRATTFHGVSRAVCARPVGHPVEDWMWSLFLQSAPSADASLLDLAAVDQRELIAALDVPLLAMIGSEDAFTPPGIGEAAVALAQRGTLARFVGCGHAPFLEDLDGYLSALRAFIETLA